MPQTDGDDLEDVNETNVMKGKAMIQKPNKAHKTESLDSKKRRRKSQRKGTMMGKKGKPSKECGDTSSGSELSLLVETQKSTNPNSEYVFDNVTLTIRPKQAMKENSLPQDSAFLHPEHNEGFSSRPSDISQRPESDTIEVFVSWLGNLAEICKNDQSILHPQVMQ